MRALNIRQPAHWSIATDYVAAMIEFAKSIADKHCYELESGLYFDIIDRGRLRRLARAKTEDGEGRIEAVDGKRNAGRLRHLAQDARWRNAADGMGFPMGQRRAGLASGMHGDVRGAARPAV